jgi:uncharacterized RDD family membrane protein YckC
MKKILVLSNLHKRFSAFIKDCTILFCVGILLFILTIYLGQNTNIVNFGLLNVFVPCVIFLLAKDTIKGKSFGKLMQGLMVRDYKDNNKIPSFIRLFVRNIFLVILPVEILFLLFQKEKRRLGDIVANTIVLTEGIPMTKMEIIENQRPENKTNKRITVVVIACVCFVFCCVVEIFIQKSEAYLTAIEYIENNQEIQSKTCGIKRFGLITFGGFTETVCEGTASFTIRVVGKNKNLWYFVSLQKENCEWKVINMSMQ